MASLAHCAFCIETLAAELEGREALDYKNTIDLWQQYTERPGGKDSNTALEHKDGAAWESLGQCKTDISILRQRSDDSSDIAD